MAGDGGGGWLFVVSGPSGAGKSTLCRRLVQREDRLEFSVSYTTRPRRDGERDGRDYHFVDPAEFEHMAAEGAFLESARVHRHRYGTGRAATEAVLAAGSDLLLDVDVQGAARLRESGLPAVSVFILPPDYTTLRRRLTERSSEDGSEVERRLAVAAREAAEFVRYDYVVVNDDLDRAYGELRAILVAERRRAARAGGQAGRIAEGLSGGSG